MSMLGYEERRDHGWRTLYSNDPAFIHGESPTAKVISYFCKRKTNDPEINITKQTEKVIDFTITMDVSWVQFHTERTLKYKRKWNPYEEYKFIALINYLDQCISGGYKKCLISKQEYASIRPNK